MTPNFVSARWCKPTALSLRTAARPFDLATFQDKYTESPCSSTPECKSRREQSALRCLAHISLPLPWPTQDRPDFAPKLRCCSAANAPERMVRGAGHNSSSVSRYLPTEFRQQTPGSAPAPKALLSNPCRPENERCSHLRSAS